MTADNARSRSVEHRRFVRVPINLDALVAIGSGAPISCTIRDFCLGGMFVSCDPRAYTSLSPPVPAVLYFALIVGAERRDHSLRLTVVRKVSNGFGAAFDNPDPAALDLLTKLAAPNGMPPSPQPGSSGEHRDLPPQYPRIVTQLTDLVKSEITELCARFLDRVDEALFAAARDAGSNLEETRFLDGQREMRRLRDRVRTEVLSLVERALAGLENPFADRGRRVDALELSDLSLVELDEFEEFLLVSKVVSELEPELQEPLAALRRRFSFLANRELDVDSIPIGPAVLCYAIAESLRGTESGLEVIARIYGALRSEMSGSLSRLYAAVNGFFVAEGVLPVIEPENRTVGFAQSHLGDVGVPAEGPTGADRDAPEVVRDGTRVGSTPDRFGAISALAARGLVQAPPAMPQGYVQAAPPAMPPVYVQAAPPAMPPGYVQAAAPAMPPGYVQAAAPAMPPGYVQAAAPAMPPGYVQAAAPAMPPGYVQAAAPAMPPGYTQAVPFPPSTVQAAPIPTEPMETAASPSQPGARPNGDSYALPDGWCALSNSHSAPDMQQILRTVRTQMALRRHLDAAPLGAELEPGGCAHGDNGLAEVLRGLRHIQRSAASASQLEYLDPDDLKARIAGALSADTSAAKPVDGEASQIVELVAHLFHALLQDPLIAPGAKAQLSRLQPLVHRAALGDSEFFSANDHPIRELIGRLGRFGDGPGEAHRRLGTRVERLIAKANLEYEDDAEVCRPIVHELDRVLADQAQEYGRQVGTLLASSGALESVPETRPDTTLDGTGKPGKSSDLPDKWNKWLDRSRALEVGRRVQVSTRPEDSRTMSLVWKHADNRVFAFADALAKRASLLSLPQVAVLLQRGIFKILDADYEERALERAMLGAVDRLHAQVESQATRDPLTGFLNGHAFVDRLGQELGNPKGSALPSSVLCHIAIENLKQVSDAHGISTANALIKAFAEALSASVRDNDPIFARLGGSELGVFWPTGGIDSAYRQMQCALGELRMVSVDPAAPAHRTECRRVPVPLDVADELAETPSDGPQPSPFDAADTLVRRIAADFVIGLCESGDPNAQLVETLLAGAKDACADARREGIGSIRIGGSQQTLRHQFARMIAYAGEALARDALTLSGQRVYSLSNDDLPPALHVAIGACDLSGNAIPTRIFMRALARCENARAIDLWAFKRTLQWLLDREAEADRFALAIVPLSAASLRDERLSDRIVAELMQIPVAPGKICFEIPDREVADNRVAIRELVDSLKVVGCRFVLDEFGSGHNSYDYIKEIDVDYVTVKSAFVKNAPHSRTDLAMAKSINELAHFAGKKTLAKQESGADLANTMREIGIDFLYDLTERIAIGS